MQIRVKSGKLTLQLTSNVLEPDLQMVHMTLFTSMELNKDVKFPL